MAGGKALKNDGFVFDVAHTSVLQRAQTTLSTVLEQIGQTDLPIEKYKFAVFTFFKIFLHE